MAGDLRGVWPSRVPRLRLSGGIAVEPSTITIDTVLCPVCDAPLVWWQDKRTLEDSHYYCPRCDPIACAHSVPLELGCLMCARKRKEAI